MFVNLLSLNRFKVLVLMPSTYRYLEYVDSKGHDIIDNISYQQNI